MRARRIVYTSSCQNELARALITSKHISHPESATSTAGRCRSIHLDTRWTDAAAAAREGIAPKFYRSDRDTGRPERAQEDLDIAEPVSDDAEPARAKTA
jgi:hypothetical protein